ncbi:lipopolysaccharide transport periplasmic protein LptA [Massilia niabensis]|uniref:Lipopolysaccharide export system protein LptA n=1 Tax=Massilia niabensis TaxID=544910 RepID=A0ABW0L1Q9_9BURK
MKKTFHHVLAAACLALLSLSASAEKADSLKQAVIEFDTADLDEVTQTRILTGNVIVTRGTLTLKSDRALVKETPEGYMSVTLTSNPGRVATFRQKRDGGPDLWMEGQAERIEYEEREEVVKLFSKAVVKELENGRVTNELIGPYISYDNRREVAAVRNDPSGQTKVGGGRGTLIIAPRRTAPAAAPAQAQAPTPVQAGKK